MQPVGCGARSGVFIGRLEIVPVLDEVGAETPHRAVFLRAVAMRHDDRRGEAEPGRGIGDALAVIAGRGADDPGDAGLRPAAIRRDRRARRAILKAPIGVWFSCLTHSSAPIAARQQRPAILRCRRHGRAHQRGGGFEPVERGKGGRGHLRLSRPASREWDAAPSARRRSAWPATPPAGTRDAASSSRRRGASRSCRTPCRSRYATRHKRRPP